MNYDTIISITECEEDDLLDIEVDGNHLFYANDILTHNSSSDIEITDTSESFGLPATCDLMWALITSEELDMLGQLMVKQLKNRYNDINYYKRFVLGIERGKMKLFGLEDSAQKELMDDSPVYDRTPSGQRDNVKSKFKDFK
jgi:hypothetical protein